MSCTPAGSSVPTVTGISPTSGSSGGGTTVTVNGTNFDTNAANDTVKFGTTVATISGTPTANSITAIAPAGTGTVDVTVTTGSGTSATSSADQFTYATPTVTSVSPTGLAAGSTGSITINGTNFTPTATVSVGGTAASGVTCGSATQCSATAPSKTAGTYDVVVTTGSVSSATSSADQITYAQAPTIAATFTPTSIASGSSSTLTLTISNPNSGVALTGVAVSGAALPANLSGSGAATTCTSGTASFSGGSLSLSGASIAGGASCAVTLTVTSTTASIYYYTTGVVSATAPASLTGSTATTPTGLTVNAALTTNQAVPSTTLIVGTAATAFTPVIASGGTGTLSYAFSGGTLPTGLSFSTTTGQITGTPTTLLSTTTFTVTVTDQTTPTAQTSSKTFSLTVSPPALTTNQAVATTTLTTNTAITPFTPVTASGGFGPLTYALSGGTLPAGLSFSTTSGQITGTPTTLLSATTFTVTVTDQATPTAQTSSKTFQLTVSAAALATVQAVPSTTLTAGTAASAFTPVTASGGFGTLSYAFTGGTLPTGLSFSTTSGQITGTPTTLLANTTFTVTVTDQTTPTAQTSSKTFGLTVNPAVLTTAQAVPSTELTQGAAASAFTPVTASGGFGTLSYALSGGSLPTGLSFSTTSGQITGTPTSLLSTTTFTVTVTDQTTPTAQTSSKTFQLTVSGGLTTTQAVPSTSVITNSAITPFTPVTASGGFGTLGYALSGGSLPTGLSFSTTTGQITGTPTATLSATTFTVTVTDQTTPTAQTSSKTFGLTVYAVLTTVQAVPTTTLTAGTAATAFTPVTASGGFGTLSYALSGGSLPTGLSFSTSTGQITGTPTSLLSNTTFTVTVTDQATPTAQSSSKTFGLTVNAPVLTTTQAVPSTTLTAGTAATPFSPVTASGGFGTLSYALSGGSLPTGLTFSISTGQITGTPTSLLSSTTFTVTVTDHTTPTAQTSSKTFGLAVNPVTLTTTQAVPSTTLTAGTAATAFTPVTASGGFGTLSYALYGGTLPTGLTFSTTTGQITGTPTTLLAATTFTVTVTDQATPTAQTSSKTFGLTVNPVTLTTTQAVPSTTLTAGTAATAFTPVTASGGFGTLGYALSGGSLPTGLSFSTTTGQITGTPTSLLANTTFTVTVTDQTTPSAQTSSKTFGLTVNPVTLTTTQAVSTISLATNTAMTPTTPVTASGGFGTLTYALSGGSLPAGLSFSTTTGQITGTPTAVLAATTFTATVTDQTTPTAQTSSKTFSLSVAVAAPSVSAVTPNTGPTTGGTAVTITGSNLGGATSVKFGNTSATSFTVISATQISAIAPPGSLGTVDVTVRTPSGTSPVGAADQYSYAVPTDSVNLRKLQATVTPMAAQAWGLATVGAMESAISEGFSGGGALVSPSGNGVRFNFSADPDAQQVQGNGASRGHFTGSADPFSRAYGSFDSNAQGPAGPRSQRRDDSSASSRTDDAFAALGYAGPVKALSPPATEPREWLGWAEISGAMLSRWTAPTTPGAVAATPSIYGNQVNVTAGLTRVLTPNFLVGVLGGWETFDYRSDAIQGRLKGDGWTTGAYAGWRLSSSVRLDAGVAYSGIGFDGTAGTASGSFAGNRLLVTGGLKGNYESYGFLIEPSATVYALWEHENAYIDTLGTAQAGRDFSTGRASGGLKVAYPLAWTETVKLSPYAGIYGDYYFNTDNITLAGAGALPVTPVFAGMSARTSVGVGAQFASGGQLTLGGERSGFGGNFSLWTYKARASIPFGAQ